MVAVENTDTPIWAFGVGSSRTQDVSVSGTIDGQRVSRHWVPRLISRDVWERGVNWEVARPIGATPPSAFSVDRTLSSWQWGSATDVAFYFLYELGSPILTLNPGESYDNFRFFTDGPESVFATYVQDGSVLQTGETLVTVVPIPSALVLFAGALVGLLGMRRSG